MLNEKVNKLMTTTEAKIYLGVSIHKIYKMTSNKEISHVKLGNKCYFTQQQLDAYILLHTVRAF